MHLNTLNRVKSIILLSLVMVNLCASALIYLPGVPVKPITLVKTQVALSRWQDLLNDTYGTR